MADECDDLRQSVYQRKLAQNARRAKAGKPPMWPRLKPPGAPLKRAARDGTLPAAESGDPEDTALSFDEWVNAGYSVRKGEKFHCHDINGVPQWLASQVRKTNPAWALYRKRHS